MFMKVWYQRIITRVVIPSIIKSVLWILDFLTSQAGCRQLEKTGRYDVVLSLIYDHYADVRLAEGGFRSEVRPIYEKCLEAALVSSSLSGIVSSANFLWRFYQDDEFIRKISHCYESIDSDDIVFDSILASCDYNRSGVIENLDKFGGLDTRDEKKVSSFVQVCSALKSSGFRGKYLLPSAEVYDYINHNNKGNQIVNFLEEGDYCFVGNSNAEAGRGRGSIIDAFSDVVRFNNFQLNEDYQTDYGSKTTVWVRSAASDVIPRNCDNFKLVVWGDCLEYSRVTSKQLEFLHELTCKKIPIVSIPASVMSDLRDKSNLCYPSTGLIMCYWFYMLTGFLNEGQLFGFSESQSGVCDGGGQYFEDTVRANITHHRWGVERDILQAMLEGRF